MYRIEEEMARYLSNNAKNPEVPGLQKDKHSPFTPRNKYSIGFIDKTIAYNTDALYLLEIDIDMKAFFLYRNGELGAPNDKLEMPKAHLDSHTTDLEAMFDIADCSIELPDQIKKLTSAIRIKQLEDLFKKEPELKLCLDEPKEEQHGKSFFRRLLEISTFGFLK